MEETSSPTRPLVLCLDDEPEVLASLRRALRSEPYDVVTTSDPHEALELTQSKKVGVLVTDHRMPQMTGAELLGVLADRSPTTEAILLTAYPSAPPVLKQAAGGRVRLMAKPWIDVDLRRSIRELLERRTEGKPRTKRSVSLWSTPDILEVLLKIDCRGERSRSLLGDVDRLLEEQESFPRSVALILENLRLLEDPIPRFVRRLLDRLTPWDVTVSLIDPPGQLRGILYLLDPRGTVALYEPQSESLPQKTVLILEDRPETLGYLRALIATAGLREISAFSVDDLSGRMDESRVDLAFLDLGLPEGGAIALSQRLLTRNPNMAIVGLSSLSDLWDAETCARLGFWRRLEKPYRVGDLLGALQEGGLGRPRATGGYRAV